MKDEEYLGDGVYVGRDEYGLWIWTFDGVRRTNEVAFDVDVLENLKKYLEKDEKR